MKLPFILVLLTGLGLIVPNYVAHLQSHKRMELQEVYRRLDTFGKRYNPK